MSDFDVQHMTTYTVTIYPGGEPLPAVEIEARSPRLAARAHWTMLELDHATAMVECPGSRVLWFSIEPVVAARVIDVTTPRPPSPLSERALSVVAGCVVRPPLSEALAHLDPQPRSRIHVHAEARGYPSASLGVLGGGLCDVLAVFDYIRDFGAEDPVHRALRSATFRGVEIVERSTGLRGWVAADGVVVVPQESE